MRTRLLDAPACGAGLLRGMVAMLLMLSGFLCGGCEGSRGPQGPPGQDATGGGVLEDGLVMEIVAASIGGDLRPWVEFTLADDEGNPVDLSDVDGDPRFGIAWIEVGTDPERSRYQSYIVNDVAGRDFEYQGEPFPPALPSATQAQTDSAGTFDTLDIGMFRYTYGTAVPAGYDAGATHTVAGWVERDDTFIANSTYSWVPDGSPVTETRDITPTSSCNQCHDPLAEHGGARMEVGLCQVCHTSQTTDPESANPVELFQMVHKLHSGADLNNLPYLIVGFRQSVHDYSDVEFPQDLRNCTTCHMGGSDSDYWKTRPSRLACGSCHDDVNFATGENHQGIMQTDDTRCSICHPAEQTSDLDLSVTRVHLTPYETAANPNLTLTIRGVGTMTPGSRPSVSFTIADDDGPVDITDLNRVAIVFAGPTTDYTELISVSNRFTIEGGGASPTLVTHAVGEYTYLPDGYTIPVDATGTWSVGMEARTEDINTGFEMFEFGSNNPVVYVDTMFGTLAGGDPQPRRQVVDQAKCNVCHSNLRLHGQLRGDIEYCVMCHNPYATDEGQRPDLDPNTNPPETIDFKILIHKIHRGVDLENDYTVYGFGGNPHNYNGTLFPGDLRNCEKCHRDDTYLLPLPQGNQATVVNIAGTTVPGPEAILPPASAACTSCHDGDDVALHASLNSVVVDEVTWAESCTVCHGDGSVAAVSTVHSRR